MLGGEIDGRNIEKNLYVPWIRLLWGRLCCGYSLCVQTINNGMVVQYED